MLEVRVEHLGDAQFEVTARGHKIVCDQPVEAGGYDEGMTPPEFLLAALGSCAGYYAADYLRRQRLAVEGTKVLVTAEKKAGPPRLDHFRVEIDAPLVLTKEQEAGLKRAVGHCLVHNTLLHTPGIEISLNSAEAGVPGYLANG